MGDELLGPLKRIFGERRVGLFAAKRGFQLAAYAPQCGKQARAHPGVRMHARANPHAYTAGHDGFRGVQEAAVRGAVAGRDALVLMPTVRRPCLRCRACAPHMPCEHA